MAGIKLANGEAKIHKTSVRYTETVRKILEKVKGEGFNNKFENICLEFHNSIPERADKIKKLDREISMKQESLEKLKKEIQQYENIKREFENFLYYINRAKAEANVKIKKED